MATSYDKVVKLACKPKAAPPKTKYLDPIIAATWSEDGAVHDVCKALSPRFREPNAIIVFKALIVLHTMIRNGATDNVLAYLSSSDVLRLRNISAGHWEGYNAPQNLQNYALYLDARIRAYRDLKHDAIRVQSETNRDMRNSAAINSAATEEQQQEHHEGRRRFGRGRKSEEPKESTNGNSAHQRSKTIAGRKLRVMTVEKGLLRETKVVQKMIDSLVECRFYLDDLEDELNITALRMLVKDLLILFQACNEGVINVLEHYFEMSKIDAKEALDIYRHFCKETERVVEYLGVAKKLQNLLNVPIPNLRHAPVSLAGSLEEYLNDPNFEQNRIEYKTNKEAADRNVRNGVKSAPISKAAEKVTESKSTPAESSSTAQPTEAKPATNKAMIDFFSAIEEEQQSMFNPQTNSPTSTYFQQQAAYNPFSQQQMMTGAPFAPPQIQQPVQMQPTGFLMPQHTTNPFGQQQPSFGQQMQQPFGQQPQGFGGSMLQPQATGMLIPQSTGANPFRQSTLFPQSTGMPGPFGMQQPQIQQQVSAPTGSTNPFPTQGGAFGGPSANLFPDFNQLQPQPTSTNPFPSFTAPATQTSFASPSNPFPSSSLFSGNQSSLASPIAQPPNNSNAPPRSASVPLGHSAESQLQPVKTHQTGSRNPFGVPVTAPPPVPKVPTLMELAMGYGSASGAQTQQFQPSALQPTPTGFPASTGPSASAMSSIASSFSANKSTSPLSTNSSLSTGASLFGTGGTSTSPTATGSTFSNSLFSSSLSSQPTGATATSSTSPAPLQPQSTGFTGLKAFKPSSSFGAALLESLPPIPQSAPTTPGESRHNPTGSLGSGTMPTFQPTGFGSGVGLGSTPGSTVGTGLRPQATGAAGAANPFRATMFSLSPATTNGAFGGASTPSPFGTNGGLTAMPTGMPGQFSSTLLGGGAFGTPSPGAANTQQQQQNGHASLI
ncbi:hypothetical protein PHLCEN_2v6793 [Hermanssonia centrifuga]|uniref:ENTH domain-containing protein n=1 Tax=Hermanssonia centrifuga TaxID=98765 RepID=A0A2R6NYE8_9APHY|nr:hypothetical protein PHLCEN_2v6793 [Hermanssonia centrifuga]